MLVPEAAWLLPTDRNSTSFAVSSYSLFRSSRFFIFSSSPSNDPAFVIPEPSPPATQEYARVELSAFYTSKTRRRQQRYGRAYNARRWAQFRAAEPATWVVRRRIHSLTISTTT